MPSPIVQTLKLVCHPESHNAAVRGISVAVRRASGDELAIGYTIAGEFERLLMPPTPATRTAHELWKHTCCECFIARKGHPEYYEFNFSPSGEWAAYAFSNYREGVALIGETLDPRIAVRRFADRLELDASIALERFPLRYRGGALALGLSAVIEDVGGELSYWALRHPSAKPDFHHRDSFTLELLSY
ncbi:MAG TPA: DOMON-like domain-containing protein [Burkholderiales bacterium]|nr:DOMON-like domain-containing protein [Burkholderiales bacterium]